MTPKADWPIVAQHLTYQYDTYRRYMIEGTDQPEPRAVDPERYRRQSIGSSGFDGFLYGTPERVAADISQHYAGTPVETVIFWASLAGMPEPMVLAHIADVAAVADRLSKQDVITRR